MKVKITLYCLIMLCMIAITTYPTYYVYVAIIDAVERDTVMGIRVIMVSTTTDTGIIGDTAYFAIFDSNYAASQIYILEDTLNNYYPDTFRVLNIEPTNRPRYYISMYPKIARTGIVAYERTWDGTYWVEVALGSPSLCSLLTAGGTGIKGGYADSTGFFAVLDTTIGNAGVSQGDTLIAKIR